MTFTSLKTAWCWFIWSGFWFFEASFFYGFYCITLYSIGLFEGQENPFTNLELVVPSGILVSEVLRNNFLEIFQNLLQSFLFVWCLEDSFFCAQTSFICLTFIQKYSELLLLLNRAQCSIYILAGMTQISPWIFFLVIFNCIFLIFFPMDCPWHWGRPYGHIGPSIIDQCQPRWVDNTVMRGVVRKLGS